MAHSIFRHYLRRLYDVRIKGLKMKPDPITKLIQAIAEYHAVFGDPLPFKVVTARFHRRLNLEEALSQLQTEGIIQVHLNRRGGKALTLSHLDYSNSTALKEYSPIQTLPL